MSNLNEDDGQLLRAYAIERDRAALDELVRRHVSFVYACARRQTHGDASLADDVTQAVFIVLATKPPRARRPNADAASMLRNWLWRTTRYAAANATKLRNRRAFHEHRAALARREAKTMNAAQQDDAVAALLDDALERLSDRDRIGVMMTHGQGHTFAQVGRAIGVSEEAARKRVARAIVKLREFFAARGVTAHSSAIGAALGAHGQAMAPAALGTSSGASAWAAAIGSGIAPSSFGAAATIACGARRMIVLAKLKVAATFALAICAVTLTAAPAVVALVNSDRSPPVTQPQSRRPEPGGGPLVAQLDNGSVVELTGIGGLGKGAARGKWWSPDGAPTEKVCDGVQSEDDPPHSHVFCIRVVGADGKDLSAPVMINLSSGNFSCTPTSLNGAPIEGGMAMSTLVPDGAKLPDVVVRIAFGEWETRVSNEHPDGSFVIKKDDVAFIFAPTYDSAAGRATVVVTDQLKDVERRVIVIDDAGEAHPTKSEGHVSAGGITQIVSTAELPAARVRGVQLQTRSYDHIVKFKHLAREPGALTKPEVDITQPGK